METLQTISYIIIVVGMVSTVALVGILAYLHYRFPDVPIKPASTAMKVWTWVGSVPVWWLAYSVAPSLVLTSVVVSVAAQVYSDYVVSKHPVE